MDGPAKRRSWLLWLLISAAALGFVAALGTRGWALLAKARVECRALTPTTLSCSVASDGVRRAKACWDAVLECAGTVHRAHACSRPIPSRSTESYTIGDFSPRVEITEACGSMRVENITVE